MDSEPFPVFGEGDHKIIWGDALELLKDAVPDKSISLIFADPPYNIGKRFANSEDKWDSEADYLRWCYQWLELCLQKLTPNGSFYVMCSTQSLPYFDIFLRERIHILSRIVWAYDSSGVQARTHFGSLWEPILHCVNNPKDYVFNTQDILVAAKTGAERKLVDYRKPNPAPYNTQKVPGNVWSFPRVRYRMQEYEEHPTQKPEALLERIILASSKKGDMILDPFAGTFTTGAVAQRLQRKSISLEQDRAYIKIGLRRLSLSKTLEGEALTPMVKTHSKRDTLASHSLDQLPLFEQTP